MKYFIILLIASFVFFGCDANNAGDGNTEDPGSNGSTGPFEGLGLCVGSWGEVENGTTISHENEDYSSIINQAGLEAIKDDLTARYILCNDIEIDSESAFTQINPDLGTDSNTFDGTEFTGTLEGNDRTISNLRIQAANREYVGLFGKIGTDGEVKDLYLSLADLGADPSISGVDYVGALVGENAGTITNVRVTGGYIKGTNSYVGGLVGYNEKTITASYATGSVAGLYEIGGLVGFNSGEITQSYATGTVTGTVTGTGASGGNIGGLIGFNNGEIAQSYATGNVTGNSQIGGLVGSSNEEIAQSYATGSVTGNSNVGGLVGQSFGYNAEITASYATGSVTGNSNVGGLVGFNNGGITASYVTGSVEEAVSTSIYIGGLVGYNDADGTIAQSHASSSVTGNNNIGGLIGANNGEIAQSYATGSVTGNTNIGGLVGLNSDTITASYATGSVTGNSNVGGLVGDNPFTSATITASYFDATTTGQSDAGAQGVTAYHTYTDPVDGDDLVYTQANGVGDLIAQGNFPDWDDTIWTWQEGQWPTFQFQ